ncbi:hypothetical protein [Streptomyces sp. NPDC127092]
MHAAVRRQGFGRRLLLDGVRDRECGESEGEHGDAVHHVLDHGGMDGG